MHLEAIWAGTRERDQGRSGFRWHGVAGYGVLGCSRGKRSEERSHSNRSLPDWSSGEWESQDE